MFQRISEAAISVMRIANQEATQAGKTYIGTEDILVAIAIAGDGIAAQVLRSHGIDAIRIRSETAKTPQAVFELVELPGKKVVENALEAANELNHTEMNAEHLFLGLLNDQTSLASRALVGLGMDLGQLQSEILSRLTPGSASAIAQRKSVENRFQDHPRVQALTERIRQAQVGLEQSVKKLDFQQAASYRDERLALQRALDELFTELDREQQ